MAKKYYAVKSGKKTGIFTSWDETKRYVQGYSNAKFKSFNSIEEAERYIGIGDSVESMQIVNNEFIDNSVQAYIDGSFSESENIYSFGAVLINDGGIIAELSSIGDDKDIVAMRNVAGELLGAMEAIKWACNNDFKQIEIFYDYLGIENWATGEWQAKKEGTKKYVKFIEEYKNIIYMKFTKVKAHSGVEYNERADRLAANAINQGITKEDKSEASIYMNEINKVFYEIMNDCDKNNKFGRNNIRFNGLDIDSKKLDTFVKKIWKLEGRKITDIKSKFVELDVDKKSVNWTIVDKDDVSYDFEMKL